MNGLLNKFEPAHTVRKAMLMALWVLAHLLLIAEFTNVYWANTLVMDYVPLVNLTVVACVLFEIFLLSALAGMVKHSLHFSRGIARILLVLLLASPLYLYFALVIVSWLLQQLGLGLLDWNMLRAFLVDTALIFRHFTSRELSIAFMSLGGPALIVTLLVLLSPERKPKELYRPLGLSLVPLCIACYCLCVVPAGMNAVNRSGFRASVGRELLPSLTLFWSALLPLEPLPKVADFSGELVPKISLSEYATAITPEERPNIVLVIVEALRSDMINDSVDGQLVMPNVHRLAEAGAFIENTISPSSESAYSMTSILTGLFPMKLGYRDTFTNTAYPHTRIYDVLSAAGYRTAFFSSANENWQNMISMTASPLLDVFFHAESIGGAKETGEKDDGFNRALREGHLKTGKIDDAVTVEQGSRWLAESVTGKPFFAVFGLQTSHFPYEQGAHVPKVFEPSDFSDQDRSEISFVEYPPRLDGVMKNRYRNSLHYIDALISKLANLLAQRSGGRETMIIVTGDHGELFHEHGLITHATSLYNVTTAVPLVFHSEKKRISLHHERAQLIDLAPTIIDMAGLPAHPNFQGRSMLTSEKARDERPIFSSVEGVTMKDAVFFGGLKLMYDHRLETYELYDLRNDWSEKNNLAAKDLPQFGCLKKLLENFRGRQITYYSTIALYSNYFPPKHEGIPAECR